MFYLGTPHILSKLRCCTKAKCLKLEFCSRFQRQIKMNSEARIGQFPPFWPIGFLFPALALCAKRISADHARKGKKRKARGRKKRNAPRNEQLK